VVIGIFATLQLATLINWATAPGIHSLRAPATVAFSLSFVASLVLFSLSYLEHSKSLRPSALLNAYLFFTVLFDIVVVRTLWTTLYSSAVRDLFTASFAIKAVILLLEAKEKRKYLNTSNHPGPEETSGLYSESLLWWLNSIIRQGYRQVLKPMDLYPMNESMSSEVLNEQFWKQWNKGGNMPKLTIKQALIHTPSILEWPTKAGKGYHACSCLAINRAYPSASSVDRVHILPTVTREQASTVPSEWERISKYRVRAYWCLCCGIFWIERTSSSLI
jgi:ATP-binding cassette, subfamily C (CFTR/MRP), member 1